MLAQNAAEKVRQPHPVDVHVGGRVRLRRVIMGYSQEKLAHSLGLTFQQIQKYERGANRISASKLFELARVLDVPVTFFFEGVETEPAAAASEAPSAGSAREGIYSSDPDFMTQRETLQLISSFYRIEDLKVRTEVLSLLKTLGKNSEG